MNMLRIDHLIELRGVYDGWSIAVYTDGTMRNRWAEADGTASPGYERRWFATEQAIADMLDPPEKVATTPPAPRPSRSRPQ